MSLAVHSPAMLAFAAVLAQQSCDNANGVSCTAGHLLHWLYVLAAVLAVVLVLVVVLAVRLWHKNRDADLNR